MKYAIAIGRKRKIVDTWAECKTLVEGYPDAKFKKVDSFEEGERYIEETIRDTVEALGYEYKTISKKSNLPYKSKMRNIFITIRSEECSKGIHFKELGFRVGAVIVTNNNLPLPDYVEEGSWDKRNKYLFERTYFNIGISKHTSMILLLQELFKIIRQNCTDVSIVLNTDSNYIIHLLTDNITTDLEIIPEMKIMMSEEINSLYNEVSYIEGLYLNYETSRHVSNDGVFLSKYLKERRQSNIE